MGKAQSTEAGSKGNSRSVSLSPAGNSDAVKTRNQKEGKKGKSERPVSYHGPVPANSKDIPVFKRQTSNDDLTGRHNPQNPKQVKNPLLEPIKEDSAAQPKQKSTSTVTQPTTTVTQYTTYTTPTTSAVTQPTVVVTPPTPATVVDGGKTTVVLHSNGGVQGASANVQAASKPMKLDSTTQTDLFLHQPQEQASFERTLDQVILIWPQFSDLRHIDVRLFSPHQVGVLHNVCLELMSGYRTVRGLQQEQWRNSKDRKDTMSELEEQCLAMGQKIRKQEEEIASLQDTVARLRSTQNDNGYTSGSDDLEERTRRSDHSQGHPPLLSDSSIDLEDSARFKSRVKGGIYHATPLVQAEGEQRSKLAVQRNHSLKPVGNEPRPVGHERTSSAIRDAAASPSQPLDADLEDKIRRLEMLLEREREENLFLRDRVKSRPSDAGQESIYESLPKKTVDLQDLVNRYRVLEEHAVGRLYGTVKQSLAQVPDRRRSQFICAAMEASYTNALSSVLQFTDTVHSLLTNPVKTLDTRGNSLQRPKPGKGHVRLFDPSQDRRRSKESSDLPDMLMKQMTSYLQRMSDVADLSSLTENVVDSLRQSFPDCTTAPLLNQSTFNQFLSDCCRLAWQAAVVNPPLYISTESLRMDDRLHETLMQEEVTNAQVDHYLWPTLFDRRNGTVLYKGRVVIKTN